MGGRSDPTPARFAARAALVAAALALGAAPAAPGAGEWHRLGTLKCSDCHTMHNSTSGGTPMRYDGSATPSDYLLRANGPTELCLACHSGGGQAPDVTVPTDFDPPGGGFPADLTDPAGQAHSLSSVPALPPSGETAVVMKCTTCHDPHGNNRYRNLRPSPSGTGRSSAIPLVVDQAVTANGTNADQVYLRSNVRYRSGMAYFCLDCHNLVADPHTPQVTLATSPSVVMSHWLNAPITNRVPVLSPTDAVVPSNDDQVFCLSCHKVHGTPHAGAFLWADGAAGGVNSTCNQCHFK
jgi:hypothetical protein